MIVTPSKASIIVTTAMWSAALDASISYLAADALGALTTKRGEISLASRID
jgi:hypothetical protein